METLLGIPRNVSPTPVSGVIEVPGYKSVYGTFAGPRLFGKLGSMFLISIFFSMSLRLERNRWKAVSTRESSVQTEAEAETEAEPSIPSEAELCPS